VRVPVTLQTSGALSLTQAQALQCYSCSEPGCCTYLQLHRFWVKHRRDLEWARHLLDLEDLSLGIDARGEWSVFWRRACRHLSPDDDSCLVHGTDVQPDVCKRYPGNNCWYHRVLPLSAPHEFVRVDRARLDWISERVAYDESDLLVAFPPRAHLLEAFAALPLDLPPLPRGPVERTEPVQVSFPLPVHEVRERADFVRMALGYPGVAVAVGDDGWRLVVTTAFRQGAARRPVVPPSGRVFAYEEWDELARRISGMHVENAQGRPTP
jgi:hypothetical protein